VISCTKDLSARDQRNASVQAIDAAYKIRACATVSQSAAALVM
jgi:hypothetical protein